MKENLRRFNEFSRDTKLNSNEFYVIEEDGGDQLHFVGIYDNLDIFVDYIKNKIEIENDINDIDIEVNIKESEIIFTYKPKRGISRSELFTCDRVQVNRAIVD
jgi:hypothetical protein